MHDVRIVSLKKDLPVGEKKRKPPSGTIAKRTWGQMHI